MRKCVRRERTQAGEVEFKDAARRRAARWPAPASVRLEVAHQRVPLEHLLQQRPLGPPDEVLEAAHKQIVVTHTWHSLEHLVRRTERALLQEVLEWHTLMSHLEAH